MLLTKATPDHIGVYQYGFAGCGFGGRTFVQQVKAAPSRILFTGDVTLEKRPVRALRSAPSETLPSTDEEWIDLAIKKLSTTFEGHQAAHGGKLHMAITGGLDSRLLLSVAREYCSDISLFVYGSDADIDVQIAKQVASAAGLPLRQVDKSAWALPDPDEYREVFSKQAIGYDGWANGSIINGGQDYIERLNRNAPGEVVVNGGLGEVMRNFFSLPARPFRTRDIYDHFFSNFDASSATDHYAEEEYANSITAVVRDELGPTDEPLSRAQVELIYPLVRGRWWTARELAVSMRFTEHLFPFLDLAMIEGFDHMPLPLKSSGRLQCAAIQTLAPDLARVPTAYGFTPEAGPSRKAMLKAFAKQQVRPAWRKRLVRHTLQHMPNEVTSPARRIIEAIADPTFSYMAPYFDISRVRSGEQLGRIAVMEWLFAHYGGDRMSTA